MLLNLCSNALTLRKDFKMVMQQMSGQTSETKLVGGRRVWLGSLLVALVVIAAYLPPIITVTEMSMLASRDGDEPGFMHGAMQHSEEWGLLSFVRHGLGAGYGSPWWGMFSPGIVLLRAFGADAEAIVWGRFVSLLSLAIGLGLVWWQSRSFGVPRLPTAGLIFLFATMPAVLSNAVRMHPEMTLFAAMLAVPALLLRDGCRMGLWWWAGVVAYGFAVGVKASAYPFGALVFAYWGYATTLRGDWLAGLLRAAGAALLAPVVFLIANFPLLIGDNFTAFRRWMAYSLESNATNHGHGLAGLGWNTWVKMADVNFLWKPFLIGLTVVGAAAAVREIRTRSAYPLAFLGTIGWAVTFCSIALVIKKEMWWNHYLIPAFAAMPTLVIGILVATRPWLSRPGGQWIAAGLLLALAIPQLRESNVRWLKFVRMPHQQIYRMQLDNQRTIAQVVREIPGDRPLVLRNWDIGLMESVDGRPVRTEAIPSERWDLGGLLKAHPADLLVFWDFPEGCPWNLGPPEFEQSISSAPSYPTVLRSRELLKSANDGRLVEVDGLKWRLTRVHPEMKLWRVYRIQRL